MYKIKWSGRSTNGNWRREVEADTMMELYNELLNNGTISTVDYDPYEKYQIEKAGYDYDEFMNSFSNEDEEVLRDAIDKLSDLNDDEIEDLIFNENGNAYYQTFKYLYDVEVTFIHKGEDIVRGLYLYAGDDEQAEESAKEELEEYLYEDCNVEINDVVIKSIKVVKQL
ncbi:MAG: hypothetical protein ACRCTZ_07860 [Sarcina sp.]